MLATGLHSYAIFSNQTLRNCFQNPSEITTQRIYKIEALKDVVTYLQISQSSAGDYSWNPADDVALYEIKSRIAAALGIDSRASLSSDNIFSYLNINVL